MTDININYTGPAATVTQNTVDVSVTGSSATNTIVGIPGQSGVTAHSALTGLGGDDHTQYHNDTRGDARYYTKTQSDAALAGKADLSGANFSGAVSATNLSGTNTGDQTLGGLGGVPTSRTITINGTTYDLSSNRSWTIDTSAVAGSSGQVQLNHDGALSADSNLFFDNTKKCLSVQAGSSPQSSLHASAAVGVVINNVTSGSASLLSTTPLMPPTGEATLIGMPAAPASGFVAYSEGGSFLADGTTYYFRIYACLYTSGGVSYRSDNYLEVSGTDYNDSNFYDIHCSWDDVTIPDENVIYQVEGSTNGADFHVIGLTLSTTALFSSATGGGATNWPSVYTGFDGVASPLSSAFADATDIGMGYITPVYTTVYVEVDSAVEISGQYYCSGSPSSTFFDDSYTGGSPYNIYVSWSGGGMGAETNAIVRVSFDGGSSWIYQFTNTIYGPYAVYDPVNDPYAESCWGQIYDGEGAVFSFKPFTSALSPSGHVYYSAEGEEYQAVVPDSERYIIKHTLSSSNGKIVTNTYFGTLVNASVFYDPGYIFWTSDNVVYPYDYGFTAMLQNRDYKLVGYNALLGIYSPIPLTLSVTTGPFLSRYVTGSFTYPAGVTAVKIVRQVNGGGYNYHKTLYSPQNSFIDDALDTSWINSAVMTPTESLGVAARFDRNSDGAANTPAMSVVATGGASVKYPKMSFGVAANSASEPTYLSSIYSASNSGFISACTNRLQVENTPGAAADTYFGLGGSTFNNTNSATYHTVIKGMSNNYLLHTRADRDTVYIGINSSSPQENNGSLEVGRRATTDHSIVAIALNTLDSGNLFQGIATGTNVCNITAGGFANFGRTGSGNGVVTVGSAGSGRGQLLFDTHGNSATVNGAIRFDGVNWYGANASIDKRFVRMSTISAGLSTSVAFYDTNGFLVSSSSLQFDGTILRPNQIRTADGTAANPIYGFHSDADTGRYRIGNDNVGESAGGTLRFDWDSSRINYSEGYNLTFGTSTGSKFGTSATQKMGWWNATPVAQSTGWSVSNVTADKSFDANATTVDELADVLGTLINQLKTYGLLGS